MKQSLTSAMQKIVKRPWNSRGHADHDWLYTFHSFSFASYHDPKFENFGPLRVINEDHVRAGTGFGAHRHAEYLIWSYIVNGSLEHKDSLGNTEVIKRGEVQFTSAGTGIRHAEFNRDKNSDVHFLQIWATPNVKGLTPAYYTRNFSDEAKQNKLVRIIEAVERHKADDNAIPAHADVSMSASILDPGKSVAHDLVAEGERKMYVQLVMSGREQPKSGGAKITVGDTELAEGDAAFITGMKGGEKLEVTSTGDKPAEFLLFDLGVD